MSGEKNKQPSPLVVPVGIDLGSLHARVAIADARGGGNSSSSSSSVQVVSNLQGQRYTVALSTLEGNGHQGSNGGMSVDSVPVSATPSPPPSSSDKEYGNVIFGDSARKLLEVQKKCHKSSLVRNLVRRASSSNLQSLDEKPSPNEDVSTNGVDSTSSSPQPPSFGETVSPEEAQVAAQLASAFFSHLAQLACDASSSAPRDLRCVASVPVTAAAPFDVDAVATAVESGFLSAAGTTADSAPGADAGGGKGKKKGGGKNKQQQRKQKSPQHEGHVIGVITEPAAVCVAHGLSEGFGCGADGAQSQKGAIALKLEKGVGSSTHHGSGLLSSLYQSITTLGGVQEQPSASSDPRDTWQRCLVIDWGAGGITATVVSRLSGDGSSKLLAIDRVEHDPTCSGREIVNLLCRHVATAFERRTKLVGVMDNKKAVAKLTAACEAAVRTLSRTNSAIVSIDGVYEGADLHVPVSRPRFEMLVSPLLRKAQAVLSRITAAPPANGDVASAEGLRFDAVLTSGNVCDMSAAAAMISKMFPDAWRGDPTVPSDEAIAMGCAKHAGLLLSTKATAAAPELMTGELQRQPTQIIDVSPLQIGVALVPTDPVTNKDEILEAVVPIIRIGSPLPTRVNKCIEIDSEQHGGVVLAIVETGNDTPIQSRVIGRICIPPTAQRLELSLELKADGELSVYVNGEKAGTL